MGRHRNGEIWKNQKGELCIRTSNGKRTYHRFLVEEFIGYRLPPYLTIHHIDGNHSNNNLSNLMIVSDELHTLLHQYGFTDKLASNLYLYKKNKDKRNIGEINGDNQQITHKQNTEARNSS